MLLTDSEIKEVMKKGELVFENYEERMLQPASYDMRVGKTLLISGQENEINMEERGSVVLKAGQFALITTQEGVKLSDSIVGHIGLKSYYVRKGVIILAGLQIDPGFNGVLVLGVYNASSRGISLDYSSPLCTVEFHKLEKPVKIPFNRADVDEQQRGHIPKADRDYLKTLETQSLSEMSESVRFLSENVASLTRTVNKVIIPLTIGILVAVIGSFIATP